MSTDDDERETAIYHGTTLEIAQAIFGVKKFDERKTWFAATRDLAIHFAKRTRAKQRVAQSPAIVKVVLYESDLVLYKRNKVVASTGFDEDDDPLLRGKTQLVFSSDAIRFLNRDMFTNELSVEVIKSNT
ncbi:MAG: hypothetical protein ABI434_16445 [Burkholderiaceae bacterium]